MNERDDARLSDEQLDRLVDGELSPAEYRELVRAVESHPEGWRRCALAFLEAQAWRRELGALRVERAVPARGSELPARRGRSWWYGALLAVSCAASFLLALGVSLWIQGRSWRGPDPGHFARYAPPSLPVSQASSDAGVGVAGAGWPDGESRVPGQPEDWPMGRYRLVVDDDGSGQAREVEMPVFATADPRARWLLDEEATAPREIIQALRREGNQVERRRNWIPMPSYSGVPIYVPVDELHVTPVTNRSFQ